MAGCSAPGSEDLHRRWLPREIHADIGIPAAAPPSAPAVVEDLAVHVAGVLGGGSGKAVPLPPPSPPPAPAPYQHHHPAAQVSRWQGMPAVPYAGASNVNGAPAPWPQPPAPWQVATNFASGGGGWVYPIHAPPYVPCAAPPPAKRYIGGTGVFLPRNDVYRRPLANKSPAKGGKPQKVENQPRQRSGEETSGNGTGAEMTQQQNANTAVLALPQDWTY